jgi:hypothetical protein
MRRRACSLGLAALASLWILSCASSGGKSGSSDAEVKRLKAVVIEREYHPPGSAAGGSMRGSGSWYLSLEAQDGDKTVHYHFSVTHQQYGRFPEGTRVEILVGDDELREIRPLQE